MTLTQDRLHELLQLTDEIGVLSLYAEHDPDTASWAEGSRIAINNQLRELRKGLPAATLDAVNSRVEQATEQIAALVDPTTTGRGRALFLGVASGEQVEIRIQMPTRPRAVLHDHAFIRPLVAAHDEGRPAGILLVNAEGARLMAWQVGECTPLDSWEVELGDAQLADQVLGGGSSSGTGAFRGDSHKEAFEARIHANRARLLKEAAGETGRHVQEQGWDRLLVVGPTRLLSQVVDALGSPANLRIIEHEGRWEDRSAPSVASSAWPILRSVHRDRETELLALARDRAGAGGHGVVGLAGTLSALNEGRVEHLLFSEGLTLHGYVDDDGRLAVTAGAEHERRSAPLLVEQMVQRALETGAKVTPLDDEAAEALLPDGGVAALTRW